MVLIYHRTVPDDFTIIYEKGDGGWWVTSIPEIPGAVSQGKTQKEAKKMVLDCARELMAFRREEAVRAAGVARIEHVRFAN